MTQIDKLLVNFTARALNADEVGLDCRAAFEQEYQGYYLVRDQGGMYKSEETGILWNCWWGAWEKAWNTCHTYEAAKPKGEAVDRGSISDGYHTFNELYEHRHALFAALCSTHYAQAWKSKLHSDNTMFDGWFIAGLTTDYGEITYHIPDRLWDLFKIKERLNAPEWDGHTSDDAIERLKHLIQPPSQEEL